MRTPASPVTVNFVGICTHFSKRFHDELTVEHRVVLVNAAEGRTIRGIQIAPHEVTIALSIPPSTVVETFALNGVQLYLDVGGHVGVTENDAFLGLPNLTALVQGVDALAEPSHDILLNGTAREVACYFDTDYGVLDAFANELNAATGRLTVRPPAGVAVKLFAAALPGGTVPDRLASGVELPPGSFVTLSNEDVDRETKAVADFLLHYQTSSRMPDVPQVPQLEGMLQRLRPAAGGQRKAILYDFTVGAGCSNSNYP